MAIGRMSVKVGKTGKASPHAAYIAREGQYASRLEKGEKLEATEAGNMPAWAEHAPQEFWTAADAYERANGTTYREFEVALPRELTTEQRAGLVRDFVTQEIGERHAYQWAIHTPTAADGQEQPHAHIMFSERQRDGIERDPEQYFKRYNAKAPEKGGARKGYGEHAGQTRTAAERADDLKALRGRWQDMTNAHLERAGHDARIDMRSNAERGLDVPEAKQLPSQWRGAGRAKVLEFRQSRAELRTARRELDELVPNPRAAVFNLEAERRRRAPQPEQKTISTDDQLRAELEQQLLTLPVLARPLARQKFEHRLRFEKAIADRPDAEKAKLREAFAQRQRQGPGGPQRARQTQTKEAPRRAAQERTDAPPRPLEPTKTEQGR